MTTSTLPAIPPTAVHDLLARHIHADGFTNSRGRGLMIAFDLPTPELRRRMHERLLASGLLLLTCGERSIRFRPPLNLSATEADTALEIVHKGLKEL